MGHDVLGYLGLDHQAGITERYSIPLELVRFRENESLHPYELT